MGLITQRGKEVLLQAQVVLYDRLVNPGILLGTRPKTLFVDAGKTPRGKRMEQNEIHRLLIRFAKKGLPLLMQGFLSLTGELVRRLFFE